jgi:hypothetical protein
MQTCIINFLTYNKQLIVFMFDYVVLQSIEAEGLGFLIGSKKFIFADYPFIIFLVGEVQCVFESFPFLSY